jgi:threonine/homoserine/homoserine lactone efflux protein
MSYEIPQRDDRSLGELFSELTREITTLVRQEAQLAKAEIGQKAARVGKDAGMIFAGGLILYAGLLALVAAAIIGLAHAGLHWGWSSFLVGLVVTAAGGILAYMGLQALKREDLAPRESIEALTENRHESSTIRRRAA